MTPSHFIAHVPWLVLPSLPQVTAIFLPAIPKSTLSCLALPSLLHGVSRSTAQALATASAMRNVHPSPRAMPVAHEAMAPPRMESDGSGTTRSGATSSRVPSPLQALHMPRGVLNEKLCGAGKLTPQWVRRALKARAGPFSGTARISLLPSVRVSSTLSAMRARSEALTVMRSTTRSMTCLSFLSSLGTSSSLWSLPSTCTRAKPRSFSSSNSSRNSPLRCATRGAISVSLVPSGSVSSSLTICSGLCAATRSPHTWQCCSPARA